MSHLFLMSVLIPKQTHTNVQARRISVYLLLGDNPAPSYPMVVSVVNCHQARVSDLIGLICWLYTKENREPPLRLGRIHTSCWQLCWRFISVVLTCLEQESLCKILDWSISMILHISVFMLQDMSSIYNQLYLFFWKLKYILFLWVMIPYSFL